MSTNPTPKIGDIVWTFSVNRRRYRELSKEEKATGRIYGELIWRGHWKDCTITGETRVSWILSSGEKIRKRPDSFFLSSPCFSEKELDDRCFVEENRYKLGQAVQKTIDASILRQIARLVSYEP